MLETQSKGFMMRITDRIITFCCLFDEKQRWQMCAKVCPRMSDQRGLLQRWSLWCHSNWPQQMSMLSPSSWPSFRFRLFITIWQVFQSSQVRSISQVKGDSPHVNLFFRSFLTENGSFTGGWRGAPPPLQWVRTLLRSLRRPPDRSIPPSLLPPRQHTTCILLHDADPHRLSCQKKWRFCRWQVQVGQKGAFCSSPVSWQSDTLASGKVLKTVSTGHQFKYKTEPNTIFPCL